MKASMVGRCERESLGPKRISVNLADIIADLTGARIGVFELQDRLVDFSVLGTQFQRAPIVGGEIGFAVGSRSGCEGVDGAAGGDSAVVFALAADV